MSVSSAQDFLKAAETNQSLNAEIMDALKTKQKNVFDIAKGQGYNFTQAEYKDALKAKYGDNISEDQLNSIAAGADCCCCCCPATCCA